LLRPIFIKSINLRKRIFFWIFTGGFLALNTGCSPKMSMKNEASIFQNKIIPTDILEEAKIALSFYPELKETPIEFKFKDNIEKSFMQAQPQISELFYGRKNRGYFVFLSKKVKIEDKYFSVKEVPKEVLIGWLGHELGHIVDYKERSAFGLMYFGLRYITSRSFLKEAEKIADTYAVHHGMGDYILATKNFILNHSHLSEEYKNRIRNLYLSPDEINVLVNEMEEKGEEKLKEIEKGENS
ncbi:MAG TPA: hypothetical protein VFM59_03070, partial [Salinimicrobium sp.]|nr:hypothetical protein [Salinimicrobium sp.]